MLVHQAVKHMSFDRGSSCSPPPPPCCLYSIFAFSSSPSTCYFTLLFHFIFHCSSSSSTSILCSVKLSRAMLSMLRPTGGCLVRREGKHWQGTSIVPSPHNNQHIRASFDFPTVWVPLLQQNFIQTSNQPLSLLLQITFSPLSLSPSRQCAGNFEGFSVLEGRSFRAGGQG